MKKQQIVHCIFIIMLCFIFVTSCRTVVPESKQPEKTLVQSRPHYHWFYHYGWPYQYPNFYWYWWTAEPVMGPVRTDGSLSFEEQIRQIEQHKAEIEELKLENEQLKAQLAGEKVCIDFCERLKAEDPQQF